MPALRSRLRGYCAALVLLVVLAAEAASSAASAQEFLDVWKKSGLQTLITGPVRLNLGYTDTNGKPQLAQVTALSPSQLDGMSKGLLDAKGSPLMRTGYFDSLWNAMKGSVCQDVQTNIQRIVNHSPNSAYDVQPCVMSSKSYLVATFNTSWENDQFQTVNGHRLLLDLRVPFNGVLFWVTSPHTCHHGGSCNPGQPEDPMFMFAFTADIYVICTEAPQNPANQFNPPLSCEGKSSITMDGVYGGDVSANLKQAAAQFASSTLVEAGSVAATGGASFPEAAAGFVANGLKVLVDGIGTGIALLDDQHLRDSVSAWISVGLGSGTLNSNAQNLSTSFNQLFTNCYNAFLDGFRPFAVAIGPHLSLDFGLVYPAPAKPQLKNTVASQNAGSIIAPSIAIAQPEVLAGQVLPVKASSFRGTYSTEIKLAWDKTVRGKANSILAWGPPPTTIKTAALTFDATNLKPSTVYHFSVHECDGLSCAPPSDEFTSKTEAGGANEVVFWLDKDTQHPVGKFAAPVNGGDFTANVKIPAATAPGAHTLFASIYGRPPASAPITVCQAGGCAATVGVLNVANNTMFPPNAVVVVMSPVTLRGSGFTPGGVVAIFVDNLKGQKVAQAAVGPLGNFQGSFKMPMVQAGHHSLIAVEAKPGTKPPQFVTANTPVFVQAMAQ